MSRKLPQLYYQSGHELKLLPKWAYFFMSVGQQVAAMPKNGSRLVLALTLPTRAFAATLVATGIVFTKATSSNDTDREQIQRILSLKRGDFVYVRKNKRKIKGVVDRIEEDCGEMYIFVKTSTLEISGFPVEMYASRITVIDKEPKLPKYQQTGYDLEKPNEFMSVFFGEKLAQDYILDTSFDVLILGKKSDICYELCNFSLISSGSGKSSQESGLLQDIVRVRQFFREGKSHKAEVMSVSDEDNFYDIPSSPIIIFDGAIAYIRHSHKWHKNHYIVLLDRTDRHFSDAVELLNQNYMHRLNNQLEFSMNIPNGIELMIYEERCK